MARSIIGILGLHLATAAGAQGLSPEEIGALVDEALGTQNEYQELLTDPDPRRSRAAMQIMSASGDPELVRMALDFGLSSTDPVVRRMALEGFFNSAPALQLTFDGSGLEDTRAFVNDISRMGGSYDDAMTAYAVLKVGDFDPAASCWTWDGQNQCALRLTDAGSAIHFQGYWYPIVLTEDRTLRGISTMYYTKEPVPFEIPVSP